MSSGGKVVTFTLAEEVAALRRSCGVADRSDCGRLFITGADALDLLNRLTTQKLDELPDGRGTSTVVTNGDGRAIDLLALGALDGGFWCITSPGYARTVIDWLDLYTFGEDIAVTDRSAGTFQFTVAGAAAEQALAVDVPSLDRLVHETIEGANVVLWHRLAGGADGFEIIGDVAVRETVFEELTHEGAVVVPPEAWETYRIANGMPAIDHEFGLFNNPLEARLLEAISDDKGCYTGQEVIARLQTYQKVQRRLMSAGLSAPAKPGTKLTLNGKNVGELTSVAPSLNGVVHALALVATAHATDGVALATTDGVTATLRHPAYALLTEPAS